jgi:hypothetical protein
MGAGLCSLCRECRATGSGPGGRRSFLKQSGDPFHTILTRGYCAQHRFARTRHFDSVYDLGVVPLNPGAYRWRLVLVDELQMLECWDCSPNFLSDSEPLGRADERWGGILNLPKRFSIFDRTGRRSDLKAVRGRRWISFSSR